ncbi:MAG: ABC transporter permease [Patescibacteria group bacterium]|nr:ABC transporter permease [Patescibacteria group bacterium]MCL5261748.1 ABC transporter permease [Patescibacteria group bacterium]
MNLKSAAKISLVGLRTNKSRSALTILGIVIGIAAIIIIAAVGQGAQNLILSQVKAMGATIVSIEGGREPKGLSDITTIFSDALKERELQALKNRNNVPGAIEVTPFAIVPGDIQYLGKTTNTAIYGSAPGMIDVLTLTMGEGNFFTEDDVVSKASVVVLGQETKRKLFGDSDAIGEKVKIRDRNFRVVGVLSQKGQALSLYMDEAAIIPYTTALTYLLSSHAFHNISIRAASEEEVPQVVEDAKRTLRDLHDITDPEMDDFRIMTQADAVSTVKTITGVLTALLLAVAAVSLVVGGIGIMNIMLVSVTERTREIGLRKAVGATEKDILTQFLFEAVILTAVGGLIGIIFGTGLAFLLTIILSKTVAAGWTFSFPLSGALAGFIVAAGVGLVFGIYPARQAATKNPIEALRYE